MVERKVNGRASKYFLKPNSSSTQDNQTPSRTVWILEILKNKRKVSVVFKGKNTIAGHDKTLEVVNDAVILQNWGRQSNWWAGRRLYFCPVIFQNMKTWILNYIQWWIEIKLYMKLVRKETCAGVLSMGGAPRLQKNVKILGSKLSEIIFSHKSEPWWTLKTENYCLKTFRIFSF